MSSWKALNIESDDESDVEIDDTKELQIEDALKLYQTALKYHAEGPPSFEKAAEAYRELFASEIFRYPESKPELERIELYGSAVDEDGLWADGLEGGAVVTNGSLETGPSTLPQILHLSHKNYAQFKLEYLGSRLDELNITLNQILEEASAALDHFVQALDKDDTDLDLWRRTATVGEILSSKRVARFCLEAVLDGDDEGLNSVLSLPGLEESLAGEQLRELVRQVDDQLSLLQGPLSAGKRRVLSQTLKQRLNAYREVTSRARALLDEQSISGQEVRQPSRIVLKAPQTWAELGDILQQQLNAENYRKGTTAPGCAVMFDLSHIAKPAAAVIEGSSKATQKSSAQPEDAGPYPQHPLQMTTDAQFPGMDNGKPTVQPEIAAADPAMQPPRQSTETDKTGTESPTLTLVSRKRSGEAAGLLQEGNEEGRARSKRIRARDSTSDANDHRQALIDANTRWEYEQQINEFQAADDWMFETVGNLFERIGVVGFEKAKDVRQELSASTTEEGQNSMSNGEASATEPLQTAKQDILTFLRNYSEKSAYYLLQESEDYDFGVGPQASGLNSSHSKSSKTLGKAGLADDGLRDFLEAMNNDWLLIEEVAYIWIMQVLLQPGRLHPEGNTYRQFLWPEPLKTMVVRTIVNFDEYFFWETQRRLRDIIGHASDVSTSVSARFSLQDLAEIVQTIFELHLDIYTLIKQPNSGVDSDTIMTQGDRLQRWSELARETMQFRAQTITAPKLEDELCLRYLWTTTFNIAAALDSNQDHAIECMHDLRAIFLAAGEPIIQLQNNAVMPELSVAALDREISRITTRDFFLKVTSPDLSDPVTIIENIEPLLLFFDNDQRPSQMAEIDVDAEAQLSVPQVSPELTRFLKNSGISVQLMLWKRLRDAYAAIEYKPMIVACYFRMIRMILDDLKSVANDGLVQSERQEAVLKRLQLLHDMIMKTSAIINKVDNVLECIDNTALRTAIAVLAQVLQLLQVFNVFEDSLRVGQTQPPMLLNGLPIPSFSAVTTMIHDTQLHIWMILYSLLRETIYQNPDLYPNFLEDKFDFLRCVHRNLGLRGFCGASNRVLVRMLKDEFVHMTHIEGYDSEQAQVLYDLYGLNCFLNPSYELIEHQCTHDAFLDRGAAMQAVDLLIAQANKLPIRELVKHTLKDTIEKVHGAVPRKKPTEAILRNREIYRTYLRSPVNPLDLFNCLSGEGNQLSATPIPKEDAVLASKGWYFLMGYIALSKFKSQKRSGPTPTEDIDIAIAFFMQDLEYSMGNWETWLRLAQAYDTKIEESIVWSAEKLNNAMQEIVQWQRAAVHCYIMATALAYRSAELTHETSEKMTELYGDFAMRLYSSSRDPFRMLPFANDEQEKILSRPTGMDKARLFSPLRVYTVWKFARVLFQRAIAGKPGNWFLQFMLGKCLWKMHAAPDNIRQNDQPPPTEQVVQAFVRAIEMLPDKKDSREKREPILEPHYKLVSVVHKLVSHGELSLDRAREALEHTPYARTASFPQKIDDWVPHVLTLLKNLRAADKSNWHHRMIARAAQIIYENSDRMADEAGSAPEGQLGAIEAKNEFTQQMFTKTMVLQVWRPECERAGRHFVYTSRYTRFFTQILEQLKDRPSLEALARRVRRRPHDLFEHSIIWQNICNAYLRLLRNYAAVPEGLETSTFSNIAHEDFLVRKELLEKWMQTQDTGTSATLDVLREVQELKKINQSLMKPGPMDDLIGDSYAYLFSTVGKQLWDEECRLKQEEEARKQEEEARKPPPVISPPRNPMMSLTHLMNVDGATTSSQGLQLPTNSAINPPVAAQPEPPARKKIGVGRREIRTCAEACTQKASSVPAGKTMAATRVQVVINNCRAAGGDASAETSAPGSIHDSADDESELSEFEEEEDGEENLEGELAKDAHESHQPTFPGLPSAESRGEAGSQESEITEGSMNELVATEGSSGKTAKMEAKNGIVSHAEPGGEKK